MEKFLDLWIEIILNFLYIVSLTVIKIHVETFVMFNC